MTKYSELNFDAKGGTLIIQVFNEMKELQKQSELVGLSSTITFNGCKLTAGFYDNFDEFLEIYSYVMQGRKSGIIMHIEETLPKYRDTGVLDLALNNIIASAQKHGVIFTEEEIEQFRQIINSSTKIK